MNTTQEELKQIQTDITNLQRQLDAITKTNGGNIEYKDKIKPKKPVVYKDVSISDDDSKAIELSRADDIFKSMRDNNKTE